MRWKRRFVRSIIPCVPVSILIRKIVERGIGKPLARNLLVVMGNEQYRIINEVKAMASLNRRTTLALFRKHGIKFPKDLVLSLAMI